MSPLQERLDELYRQPPEEFVAARNRLVKDLRAEGEREEAARVAKLRRPSAAASLINRVALEASDLVSEFAAASRDVAGAQGRALEGEAGAVEEWRQAATRERKAIEAVSAKAADLALAGGQPASKQVLELVTETLRAAAGDADLRELVLGARLEREATAATLGLGAVPDAAPARGRGKERRQEAERARREAERLEQELGEATAREDRLRSRVAETEEVLRREKEKLAEAKRQATSLRRQLKKAGE